LCVFEELNDLINHVRGTEGKRAAIAGSIDVTEAGTPFTQSIEIASGGTASQSIQ
jgi:hypothetical protein